MTLFPKDVGGCPHCINTQCLVEHQCVVRDNDGTRSAETLAAPVPQDCQARAVRHRQQWDTFTASITRPTENMLWLERAAVQLKRERGE